MEKGLVRANENELMEHLYELTTDGRRLFDVSGYRAFFFMGISGYILYSFGLVILINCYNAPIYDISFFTPLENELLHQQIIGIILLMAGIIIEAILFFRLLYD